MLKIKSYYKILFAAIRKVYFFLFSHCYQHHFQSTNNNIFKVIHLFLIKQVPVKL